MVKSYDVLIVGSGSSGLSAALKLADTMKVAVLCKSKLGLGSSLYAQGGIASVTSDDDSLSAHINDTLKAGDGLCNINAVKFTVHHAKKILIG